MVNNLLKRESLEEIVRKIALSRLMKIRIFNTKIKRIAKGYGRSGNIEQDGTSHRVIEIKKDWITFSPSRKDHKIISIGVFKDAMEGISETTHIPLCYLTRYFKGHGKIYKLFKKRFEEEYFRRENNNY